MSMKQYVRNIGNASSRNEFDIAKINPSSSQTTNQAEDNCKQNRGIRFNYNLSGIKRLNQSVVVVDSGKTTENPTNQANYANLDNLNDKLAKRKAVFNAQIDNDITLRKPDQTKTIEPQHNLSSPIDDRKIDFSLIRNKFENVLIDKSEIEPNCSLIRSRNSDLSPLKIRLSPQNLEDNSASSLVIVRRPNPKSQKDKLVQDGTRMKKNRKESSTENPCTPIRKFFKKVDSSCSQESPGKRKFAEENPSSETPKKFKVGNQTKWEK